MSIPEENLRFLWGPGSAGARVPGASDQHPKAEPNSKERAAINIQKLRDRFENRQGIYVEKGALLVRVCNISATIEEERVTADAEEVITPGLGVGMFAAGGRNRGTPRRWSFGAGSITTFSKTSWSMGYGGWSVYFEPEVLQAVCRLAASFPPEFNTFKRYSAILDSISSICSRHSRDEERVFPFLNEAG